MLCVYIVDSEPVGIFHSAATRRWPLALRSVAATWLCGRGTVAPPQWQRIYNACVIIIARAVCKNKKIVYKSPLLPLWWSPRPLPRRRWLQYTFYAPPHRPHRLSIGTAVSPSSPAPPVQPALVCLSTVRRGRRSRSIAGIRSDVNSIAATTHLRHYYYYYYYYYARQKILIIK